MKILFSLNILLLFFIPFTYSQTYNELKSDKERIKITKEKKEFAFKHKIKSAKITGNEYMSSYFIYDERGNMIEQMIYHYPDKDVTKKFTYKYDNRDNMIESNYIGDYDGTPAKIEYFYDNINNKIQGIEYDARMKMSQITSWVYSMNDKPDRQITINFRNDTSGIVKYFYDELNRMIKAVHYLNTNILNYTYEYKYDSRNNIIECNEFDNVGLIRIEKQEFDERGNEIRIYKKSLKSGILRNDKYIYDEYNNRISILHFDLEDTNKIEYSTDNKFIYDSNGNIIEEYSISIGGELLLQNKYEYDNTGKRIKEINYGFNDSPDVETIFSYNSRGNIIEECNYYYEPVYEDDEIKIKKKEKNPEKIYIEKYEYEYYE